MPISLGSAPTIWASDTNFSSGPNTGTPTRVNPGSGYFAQGWIPGQTVPGQYANFLFGTMTDYLASIRTAVNGKAMSVDGGTHTLTAPFVIAGDDFQVNTNLIIPNGADIEVANGGDINLADGADLNLNSGAAIELSSGALLSAQGTIVVGTSSTTTAATIVVGGGGFINLEGGDIVVENLGRITVEDGGQIVIEANGEINMTQPEDLKIVPQSQNFRCSMIPMWIAQVSNEDMWSRTFGVTTFGPLLQRNVTDPYAVAFALVLTDNDTLNSVSVMLNGMAGGGGHVATLPATKPRVTVWRQDVSGTMTQLGTAVDAPADVAAYDQNHILSVTGLAHTVSGDNQYWVLIEGESGGGAQAGELGIISVFGNVTARNFRGGADIVP